MHQHCASFVHFNLYLYSNFPVCCRFDVVISCIYFINTSMITGFDGRADLARLLLLAVFTLKYTKELYFSETQNSMPCSLGRASSHTLHWTSLIFQFSTLIFLFLCFLCCFITAKVNSSLVLIFQSREWTLVEEYRLPNP